MDKIMRAVVALVLCALMANTGFASGLVQVSMRGQVGAEAGAMIEFSVKSGSHEMKFSGMIGEGTRVGDLSALFERKLKLAGFGVTSGVEAGGRGSVSLFIDEVEEIRVRLGGGLSATVTSSEEMPREVRALPPRVKSAYSGGELRLFVTTLDSGTQGLEIHSLDVKLPDRSGSAEAVANELEKDAVRKGVISVRAKKDCWSASAAGSGAKPIALSVALYSDADWGVEFVLAPQVSSR
jgi:hypothetical protein